MRLLACLSIMCLSGCIMPTGLTVASLVVDTMSYFQTGKSIADHAISEVASADCALYYVVADGVVCRRPGPDVTPTMLAYAAPVWPTTAAGAEAPVAYYANGDRYRPVAGGPFLARAVVSRGERNGFGLGR